MTYNSANHKSVEIIATIQPITNQLKT